MTGLTGKGVVITRPIHQVEPLCALLRQHGAVPIRFPTLEIVPVADSTKARSQLIQAEQADLVIYISVNAVEQALALNPLPVRPKLAAIGQATAKALRQAGREPDLIPARQNNSEALLALPELQQLQGWQIVIVRGVGGREMLINTLRQRGASVQYAELYQRIRPEQDAAPLLARWQQGEIHAVTATSNEALQNLYDMVGEQGQDWLITTTLVVVSPRAAQLARELGFQQPAVIAENASDQALLAALLNLFKARVPANAPNRDRLADGR